jgi:hypothetical protein
MSIHKCKANTLIIFARSSTMLLFSDKKLLTKEIKIVFVMAVEIVADKISAKD